MTSGDQPMRPVERLFHEAVALPEAERAAYVTAHAPDEAVRAEVLALIAADSAPDARLDVSPEELADAAGLTATSLVGRTLGPYRIVERVGQGGMGTVYRAVRDDVESEVAIKVVRGALGDPARVLRFRQEQRVLARLTHPRIARLLDAGVADDETPYLVMEYVDGVTITEWCAANALDVEARLRLFLEVCDAVGFAHRNLIVHRDIKPSNVLVAADGHVRLLDFGVAKLLELPDDEPTLTATGARILSPEYAAPEQREGGPITTATDVYALGLLLRALLHDVSADAARPTRDLGAICACALEEEPARRYASVDLLRDDVERFLESRPVHARPPSARYRIAKFVRRNAAAVTAAALLLLLLLGGAAAVLWQARQATRARVHAEELSSFLVGMFEASNPAEALGVEITARNLLDRGTLRIDELADRPEVQARLLDVMARAHLGLADYQSAAELAARSLALERALHGARHTDIATSLATLGRIRYEQGHEAEADSLFRATLAMRRSLLGDDHDLTTGTMLDLVQVLHRHGGYDEAESLARAALDARTARHGPDHELIADAQGALALALWFSGRDIEQAESLLRASLAMRERLFGPDDPRLEHALTPLSGLLGVRGRGAEAEQMARRALDIRRRVYGAEHPLAVHQMLNVATAIEAQGRHADARTMLHTMIARYEQLFQDDHPLYAVALNNLSAVFYAEGRLDSAEHYLSRSIDMRLRMHDDMNAEMALLHHNLGSLQRAQGRFHAAGQALETAYTLRSTLYGAENPATLRTGAAWADVLSQTGSHQRAEELLREILALQHADTRAQPSADATRTMGYLARTLVRREAYDEAETLYTAALTAAERLLPDNHPRRLELVDGLASLHQVRGAPQQ